MQNSIATCIVFHLHTEKRTMNQRSTTYKQSDVNKNHKFFFVVFNKPKPK